MFAVFLLFGGCAGVRPLESGAPIELGPDEGLLIIHTVSDMKIAHLHLDGARFLSDLPKGTHLQLFAAKAGRHRFSEMRLAERNDSGQLVWRWKFRFDEPSGGFDVVAGKLNYPGQIVVHVTSSPTQRSPHARLANRSGLVLRQLRRRHPEALEKYPLVFTGSTRDDFLDAYLDREPAP